MPPGHLSFSLARVGELICALLDSTGLATSLVPRWDLLLFYMSDNSSSGAASAPLPRRLALGRWLVDESESAGCATRAQRARVLRRARTLAAARHVSAAPATHAVPLRSSQITPGRLQLAVSAAARARNQGACELRGCLGGERNIGTAPAPRAPCRRLPCGVPLCRRNRVSEAVGWPQNGRFAGQEAHMWQESTCSRALARKNCARCLAAACPTALAPPTPCCESPWC